MKIEEHIFRAFEAKKINDLEGALWHACIAVDASSQKYFEANESIPDNYIEFIRKYYWILEPMMGSEVNFSDTRWEILSLTNQNGQQESNKDIAAFIYHAFRCTQAHGNEIDPLYKLYRHETYGKLYYHITGGQLNLPEKVIWGLLAICVFAEINNDISTKSEYCLTLGGNQFVIHDWWGLENSFRLIAEKYNQKRETLEFGVQKS